jgi:hypothetical protein
MERIGELGNWRNGKIENGELKNQRIENCCVVEWRIGKLENMENMENGE